MGTPGGRATVGTRDSVSTCCDYYILTDIFCTHLAVQWAKFCNNPRDAVAGVVTADVNADVGRGKARGTPLFCVISIEISFGLLHIANPMLTIIPKHNMVLWIQLN